MGATDILLVSEFFDVEAGEISPFNLLFALIGFLSGFAVSVFGVQQGSLEIIAVGLTFAVVVPAIIVFTGFSLVTGRLTLGQSRLLFWISNLPWVLPGLVSGNFSVFSSPTGSYLSVMANTPLHIQLLTNVIMAPNNETFLFIGLAVIGFWVLIEAVQSSRLAIGILSIGLGAAFAFLHGARTPAFLLLATFFMAATIVSVLGEGTGTFDIPWIDVGLPVAIGIHFANNVSASGGYLKVVNGLLSAPEPYIFLYMAIIGVFAVGLFLAAAQVLALISKVVN